MALESISRIGGIQAGNPQGLAETAHLVDMPAQVSAWKAGNENLSRVFYAPSSDPAERREQLRNAMLALQEMRSRKADFLFVERDGTRYDHDDAIDQMTALARSYAQ